MLKHTCMLVLSFRAKQNFEKLDFLFPCSTPCSVLLLFHFPPSIAGLSLDLIYEVKVSQKTLQKAKFTRSGKW